MNSDSSLQFMPQGFMMEQEHLNPSHEIQPEKRQSQTSHEASGAGIMSRRAEAIAQRKLQNSADASSRVDRLRTFQLKADQSSRNPIQRKGANRNGLPGNLQSGIESMAGVKMGDVKVHYNSSQPQKYAAHAFAKGSQIHLASGQERHLPHEAWHVAQQKQGRVKPTTQFNGQAVNDSPSLEREADKMGAKAAATEL